MDHIVLGVARAHAQRMQLQDLAGELLVAATRAMDACYGVGTHRGRVVEVEQHRRVGLHRLQHVLEAAQVGADGLALIGPSHALDLVGRD